MITQPVPAEEGAPTTDIVTTSTDLTEPEESLPITITSVTSIALDSGSSSSTPSTPETKGKKKTTPTPPKDNQNKEKRKQVKGQSQEVQGPPKKKAKLESENPKNAPAPRKKKVKINQAVVITSTAATTATEEEASSQGQNFAVVAVDPTAASAAAVVGGDRKRSRKQQIAPATYNDDLNSPHKLTVYPQLHGLLSGESAPKRKYTKKAKVLKNPVIITTTSTSTSTPPELPVEVEDAKKKKQKPIPPVQTLIKRSKITLKRSQLSQSEYHFTVFQDPSRNIAAIGPGQVLLEVGTHIEPCEDSKQLSPLGGLRNSKLYSDYLQDPYFAPLGDFWSHSQSTLPFTRVLRYSSLLLQNSGISSEKIVKTFRFFGKRYETATVESTHPRSQILRSQSLVIKHPIFSFYNKTPLVLPFIVVKKVKYRGKYLAKPIRKIVKLKRSPEHQNNIEIFVEEEILPVKVSNVAEMTERNIIPIINTPRGGLLPVIPNKPSDLQALQLLAQQQQQLQIQSQIELQQQNQFLESQNQNQGISYFRYEPHTATEFLPVEEQINGFILNAEEFQQQQQQDYFQEAVIYVTPQPQEQFIQQQQEQPQRVQQIILSQTPAPLPQQIFQQVQHYQQQVIQPTQTQVIQLPQNQVPVVQQQQQHTYAHIQLPGTTAPTRVRVVPQVDGPSPPLQIIRPTGQGQVQGSTSRVIIKAVPAPTPQQQFQVVRQTLQSPPPPQPPQRQAVSFESQGQHSVIVRTSAGPSTQPAPTTTSIQRLVLTPEQQLQLQRQLEQQEQIQVFQHQQQHPLPQSTPTPTPVVQVIQHPQQQQQQQQQYPPQASYSNSSQFQNQPQTQTSSFPPSVSSQNQTFVPAPLPPAEKPKKPKKPRKSKKDLDTSCQLQAAPTFPPTTITGGVLQNQSHFSIVQPQPPPQQSPSPAKLIRVSTVSSSPGEPQQSAVKSYPTSAQTQNQSSTQTAPQPQPKTKSIIIVKQNQAPAQGPGPAQPSPSNQVPSTPSRPQKRPGWSAVCPHCGLCGDDLIQCRRCHKEFPPNVKLIQASWAVGTKDKVVAVGKSVPIPEGEVKKDKDKSVTVIENKNKSDKPLQKLSLKSEGQVQVQVPATTTPKPVQGKKILLVPNGSFLNNNKKGQQPQIEFRIQPDGSSAFFIDAKKVSTPATSTPGPGPLKRRIPQRKKEQECITLSSDEETEPEPPKKQKEEMPKKSQSPSKPPPPPPKKEEPEPVLLEETSPPEEKKEGMILSNSKPRGGMKISLNLNLEEKKTKEEEEVDSSVDPPAVLKKIQEKISVAGSKLFAYCTVEARSIRIGTYKITEMDKHIMPITLSELGITFDLPHCSLRHKIIPLCIPKESIISFKVASSTKLCAVFLQTGPKFAKWVMKELAMDGKAGNESTSYYSPLDGSPPQRTITFVFQEQFKPADLGMIRKIFENFCLEEIEYKEANSLLMKLTPMSYQSSISYKSPEPSPQASQTQTPAPKQKTQAEKEKEKEEETTSASPDGVPKIVSTMSVRGMKEETREEKEKCDAATSNGVVLMYEGCTSKVTISPKDITCLGYSQFLNDQIIDFWFAVILTEMLSEEDRKRTFVYDSFFYAKLTEKMKRKTAEDGTLTASERRHARVKKRTKNVDIFEKDFLIVPINENYHWFLAIICFPGLQGYHDYDTLKPLPDYKIPPKPKAPRKTENSSKAKPIVSNQPQNPSTAAYSNRDEAPEDPDECDQGADSPEDPESSKTENPNQGQPSHQGGSDNPSAPRVKRPCIIVFDSLAGETRGRIYSTLREYLKVEYKTKKGVDREFSKDTIPGCMPKVPQQPNFSDCGLFMLQYVEAFFSSPPESFETTTLNLRSWFPASIAENKRREIYEFIYAKTKEKYPQNLKYIPEVNFESDPNEIDPMDMDEDDLLEAMMDDEDFDDEDEDDYFSDEFEGEEGDSSSGEDLFVPVEKKRPKTSEDPAKVKSKSTSTKKKETAPSSMTPSITVTTGNTITRPPSSSSSTTTTTTTPTRPSYVAIVKKNI